MKSGGFPDYLDDLLSPFPGVRMRRMFGGVGIFGDGLMFALLADEVLYLKSDGVTDPRFEAEGCEPFAYGTRDGRRTIMSYRRAPERLFDDPDAFREWAEDCHVGRPARSRDQAPEALRGNSVNDAKSPEDAIFGADRT